MSAVKNDVLLPDQVRTYIKEHGLDRVLTGSLNHVLRRMPADPFTHLAQEWAKCSDSAPRFVALREDNITPRSELRFDIVATVKGVRVQVHSVALGSVLLAAAEPPQAESATAAPFVVGAQQEGRLVAFLEDFFSRDFGNVSVEDFLSLHERCAGLAQAPVPGDCVVDLPRASAALVDALMVAGARAIGLSSLEYLQRVLSQSGLSRLVSPPLRRPQDFAAWRERWPRLAMPIIRGGGPSVLQPTSLRCCAAVSPFAAGIAAEVDGVPADSPRPGWATWVMQALRTAGGEAVKLLQADKASAAMVVEGVAYGHPGGLASSLQMTRKAAEAAAPGQADKVFGVLLAGADEAWKEEESIYEVEAGKKLSLEELVALYAACAEDGWLRLIVQPFSQADAAAGCELLQTQRPELILVQDFGPVAAAMAAGQPARATTYSCLWRPDADETLALMLGRHAELAREWGEATSFGRCVYLSRAAATHLPGALLALMALAATEVVCLAEDVAPEDVKKMSDQVDEVLFCVMCEADSQAEDAEADGPA